MEISAVVERVREIASVRATDGADRMAIEAALRASSQLRAWLASCDAALTARLSSQVSFPEQAIAESTRSSLGEAGTAKERSDTLTSIPSFADALDRADVTAAHVDAITRAGKPLEDAQRSELFERVAGLVDVASVATVDEFRKRLALEVRSIQADDGLARLERRRRAARLRSWTDSEGMWRFDGRFDPALGVKIAARLDAELETFFAEAVPDTCPTNPIEKQRHLRALAFARLVTEQGGRAPRPGRPEYVVVIDASQTDGAGGSARTITARSTTQAGTSHSGPTENSRSVSPTARSATPVPRPAQGPDHQVRSSVLDRQLSQGFKGSARISRRLRGNSPLNGSQTAARRLINRRARCAASATAHGRSARTQAVARQHSGSRPRCRCSRPPTGPARASRTARGRRST